MTRHYVKMRCINLAVLTYFAENFRYLWLATHVCPFLLHLGGLSLLWTTPIIIRPQSNRGTKRTETGLCQNKKGTAPTAVHTGD